MVSTDEKVRILGIQRTEWERKRYSDEVNARVARQLEDNDMLNRAIESMANCERAVDVIDGLIAELKGEKDDC